MQKWKKILLISVIALVASMILGNIFNSIGFEIGRYLAMAILYISAGSGAISLIGYFISKKGDNEKVPTWIIAIVGIIVAIIIANLVASAIESAQNKREEMNRNPVKETLESVASSVANNSNSSQLDTEILKIARQKESTAWAYNSHKVYKTLSNGNVVVLVEYKAKYTSDYYFLLAEFNKSTGKCVKKTDVVPESSGVSTIYSINWN